MAFSTRGTYLCYNNSDLIRDGYIKTRIEKEYVPVDTFNVDLLKNPPKGVNYVVIRDDETREIVAVKEVKKQLPASKIKIEIDFSKVMRNAVTHPFSPASFGLPMANILATPMLSPLGIGGITSGLTYITVHLLDAETKFNRPITVTKKMVETGIWECEDGYPLSVFGIVKDHLIESEGEETDGRFTNGLDFDENNPLKDPTIIGKYSDGVWKGSRRKRISGATDNNGLFGSVGEPEIKFENVAYDDQQQLFVKIVKDDRILKFRGDNYDASGGKDYPFRLSGVSGIDATNKQIKLKLVDDNTGDPLFSEGDTIFITYSVALKRHVRQNLSHRGDIAQGNTIGIVGFRGSIKSIVDAWDYKIKTWKVPLLPSGLEMKNIDGIDNFYTKDNDYKLTLSKYLSTIDIEEDKEESELCDTLEGWRLSESITNGHVKKFWTADYRGILLYNDGVVEIIYPESKIRDQDWFRNYLESLNFIHPTGGKDVDGNDIYAASDLRKKIDNNIDLDEEPGFLFDLTEISNSLLFDREKIPYHRPFANALRDMNKYQSDDNESGIGIILLDLIKEVEVSSLVKVSDMNLELYDLSHIEFYNANAQPLKSYQCEELFDIHSYNYWSESYDANTDDGSMGAWYDRGYIDNEVFEWRPSGGSIESYWKLETPYFCGEYTAKSRVYIEKMYGNSLDNYSWIFVDSDPFIPHNISSDNHHNFDESVVVFNDNNMHYGLCYHKFVGSRLDGQSVSVKKDDSRSHVKEPYDYNKDFIVGQNRILGDSPSYSNGIPIVDDIIRVCKDSKGEEFWFSKEIYDGASYGLDFENDPPRVSIPDDWFIRNLVIEFFPEGFHDLTNIERYVSFYFEGSESSISDIKVLSYNTNNDGTIRIIVDFKYYYNGPLQFLGNFWKQIKIKSVMARYTTTNDNRNVTNIDINDYKIKSGQNAVVYDTVGRLLVFYANNTSNIDVAISYDDGKEWIIHKNLIRLIEGETVGLPFVISDKNVNYVHLYYTLNDIFLMYKRINTDFFVEEDAFVEYVVPASYDVDDYNQKKEKPEEDYWGYYTNKGKLLRQYPSYFIAGDCKDPYFIEQIRIKDALNTDYIDSPKSDVRQVARFDFSGNQNEMKDSFKGDAYAVYMDNEGVFRLFMLSNGKLSIKRSNNYFSWKYDVEEQIIHKDFIDEQLNKGMPEGIQNIQIVRNDYTGSFASVLYFHNGMLFIRHFQSDLLFPFYSSNGEINNENMKKQLEISNDTKNKPIFLVGKMPTKIKDTKIKEINNGIGDSDSDLFIYFPYDKDMLEKFDERFDIDTNTQVYAYTSRNGLIRIFYKDSFGNLNGIILDAFKIPILEVMNKFKDN